jgi:hypothetical protein
MEGRTDGRQIRERKNGKSGDGRKDDRKALRGRGKKEGKMNGMEGRIEGMKRDRKKKGKNGRHEGG